MHRHGASTRLPSSGGSRLFFRWRRKAGWSAKPQRTAIGNRTISCAAFDLNQKSFVLQVDDVSMRKFLVPLKCPHGAKDKTERRKKPTVDYNDSKSNHENRRAFARFKHIFGDTMETSPISIVTLHIGYSQRSREAPCQLKAQALLATANKEAYC